MRLPAIREKIDALDDQLLKLLNERAELVHEVGLVKREEGTEIYAPEREELVLRTLAARNAQLGGRLPESAIRAIYREIMSASLALEKAITIAFVGPETTSTHEAARGKFGASVRYAAQGSVAEVFDVVARGNADYGVVAIESSIEDSLSQTFDMFIETELRICAQILMPTELSLVAKIPREDIRRVFSHPQIFGQCRRWLRRNLPRAELIEVPSTPRAAELAASESGAAAITGRMAAEAFGLGIVAHSIQDLANQTSRFLILGRSASPPAGDDHTALIFSVLNQPGALFRALAPFNALGIRLNRVESRSSNRRAWEHCFFIEIDGHVADEKIQRALETLRRQCAFVKILGTYPKTGAG